MPLTCLITDCREHAIRNIEDGLADFSLSLVPRTNITEFVHCLVGDVTKTMLTSDCFSFIARSGIISIFSTNDMEELRAHAELKRLFPRTKTEFHFFHDDTDESDHINGGGISFLT